MTLSEATMYCLEIRITEKQTEKCRSTNQATVKKEKFFSSKWC